MTRKYLTTSQRNRFKPILIQRDGHNCFYCKEPLTDPAPHNFHSKNLKTTFDHLDDDPFNHEIANLVLCHFKCNQDKKRNFDFQVMAKEKIKENHSFDSLGVCDSTADRRAPKGREPSIEIDINKLYLEQTRDYLNDRLVVKNNDAVNKKDAARSIAFLVYQKINQGSYVSAQRAIEIFTSSAGPYFEEDIDGATLIFKKQKPKPKINNISEQFINKDNQ